MSDPTIDGDIDFDSQYKDVSDVTATNASHRLRLSTNISWRRQVMVKVGIGFKEGDRLMAKLD